MDQIAPKSNLYCPKCQQPLVWHSSQTVKAGKDEETMDVFKCEACGRLSALPSVDSAA